MPKSTFVRVLFGDAEGLPAVHADIKRMVENKTHPSPVVTYCYGDANFAFLESQGIEARLMEHLPVWNKGPERRRNSRATNHQVNFGLMVFAMKLRAIFDTLNEGYDEVILLDWDTELTHPGEPLPGDFWDRMRGGQAFQTGVYQLTRPHFWWRPVPLCSQSMQACFIYCRSKLIAQQLMTLQFAIPLAYEEDIMGVWAEMRLGGWDGESARRWRDEGYQPYCMSYKKRMFEPEEALFVHGKIYL